MCCGQTGLQQRLEESELQRGGKRGGKTKQIELESEQRHTESTGQLTTLQADLAARDNQLSELQRALTEQQTKKEAMILCLVRVLLQCACLRHGAGAGGVF